MKVVTIHDAKTNLSRYIAAAKKGEKVFVGSFGKPEIELVPAKKSKQSPNGRVFGTGKYKFNPTPDAFSQETDDEIARLMYGE